MSREHWLEYRAGEGFDVRFGRLVLPFGIRQPDHTQYVREDFGLGKYDQSYSVEVDYNGGGWSVFGNMFAGDLTAEPEARQARGLVLTASREVADGGSVGISALGEISFARRRFAGSLFGRAPLGGGAYVMGEVATQHRAANRRDASLSTIAEYLRLGWFVLPEMDLFVVRLGDAGCDARVARGGHHV